MPAFFVFTIVSFCSSSMIPLNEFSRLKLAVEYILEALLPPLFICVLLWKLESLPFCLEIFNWSRIYTICPESEMKCLAWVALLPIVLVYTLMSGETLKFLSFCMMKLTWVWLLANLNWRIYFWSFCILVWILLRYLNTGSVCPSSPIYKMKSIFSDLSSSMPFREHSISIRDLMNLS